MTNIRTPEPEFSSEDIIHLRAKVEKARVDGSYKGAEEIFERLTKKYQAMIDEADKDNRLFPSEEVRAYFKQRYTKMVRKSK